MNNSTANIAIISFINTISAIGMTAWIATMRDGIIETDSAFIRFINNFIFFFQFYFEIINNFISCFNHFT
jgi:hypothetical protein